MIEPIIYKGEMQDAATYQSLQNLQISIVEIQNTLDKLYEILVKSQYSYGGNGDKKEEKK